MITNGVAGRTVQNWIADEHSRSTVKNTNAVLVRVMEQVVRDGMIKVNLARVTGWQRLYMQAEDKLLSPRALAVPDWETLVQLADALWLPPTSCTAAGETSSFSLRALPHESAKCPDAASGTSTPASGSGPCGARPLPPPVT
ncbi:MAG TPA: hypothetical protein VIS29_03630 [Streptomyces sp.]